MARGRLTVTGFDNRGRNIFLKNGDAVGDGPAGIPLWEIPQVPPPMDADGSRQVLDIMPPRRGLSFQYLSIVPNTRLHGREYRPEDYHETDTIDLITMISGEVWMMLEGDPEGVLLKAGDVLVQRGTSHLWHNKGIEPAVFTVVLVAGERTEKTPRATSGARSVPARKE